MTRAPGGGNNMRPLSWGGGGAQTEKIQITIIDKRRVKKIWIFSVCAPPPSTLCSPQLQSTCHYIVNHYVKILHVHLGVANNMHPLSWGGGHKRKRSKNLIRRQFIYIYL